MTISNLRLVVALLLALSLAIFAAVLTGSPGATQDATDQPPEVITDGPISAVVPPEGQGVHVEAITETGVESLSVSHLPGGQIEVHDLGDDNSPPMSIAAVETSAGDGCGDSAYRQHDWKLYSGFHYRINYSTTPAELTNIEAINAIRGAGQNVADTLNGCGLGDRVPVGIAYEGESARYPNMEPGTGRCANNDNVSVVAFGGLSDGILAITCIWFSVEPGWDRVDGADAKINPVHYRWTTNPGGAACNNEWDLEGVMTHEFGHTFGLDHVAEDAHPNLTMSNRINGPCQGSERNLGRGDVLGLDAKYN